VERVTRLKHHVGELIQVPAAAAVVVGCKIPRKENSPIFGFFLRPPLPVSPGSPEVDPAIDQTKRPG